MYREYLFIVINLYEFINGYSGVSYFYVFVVKWLMLF